MHKISLMCMVLILNNIYMFLSKQRAKLFSCIMSQVYDMVQFLIADNISQIFRELFELLFHLPKRRFDLTALI